MGLGHAARRVPNDPRLTDQEIQTIVSWIDGGAPKGDMADMPKMPALADGWTIGKPDAVYSMTEDLQDSGRRHDRVPVHPDSGEPAGGPLVHRGRDQAAARARTSTTSSRTRSPRSDKPTRPGNTFGPTNITGVSPNKPGLVFEPGVAKLLRAGHDIILQMHYTTNGTEAVDRTQVGLIFAKEPPKQVHVTGLAVQPRFVIPAGDPNAEVKAVAEIRQDTVMTSLTPHMHVRGKDMTYTAFYPDGTSEVLLTRAEVRLQLADHLRTGRSRSACRRAPRSRSWRTSTTRRRNKYNPDPTKDVTWGDQTWEEMMIGFWGSVVERPKQ